MTQDDWANWAPEQVVVSKGPSITDPFVHPVYIGVSTLAVVRQRAYGMSVVHVEPNPQDHVVQVEYAETLVEPMTAEGMSHLRGPLGAGVMDVRAEPCGTRIAAVDSI